MVEFALATISDLPDIVEIYNQAIPGRLATADLETVTLESKLAWFESFNTEHHPLWVIKVNQQIAGWVALSAFHERAAYAKTAEISIYLDHQFQHHGLGQQALEFVETQVAKLEITTIVALIFAHNQASQGLFTKNGFQKWAHLPAIAELDGRPASLDMLGKQY